MLDKKLVTMLYEKGHGYTDIANIIGVSKQRVHQIIANYKNYGIRRLNKKERSQLSNKCKICHDLAIHRHHIDKNNANDSINNLMPICLKCHKEIHKGEKHMNKYARFPNLYQKKIYKKKARFLWSRNYEKCQWCNTINTPHASSGICQACFYLFKKVNQFI